MKRKKVQTYKNITFQVEINQFLLKEKVNMFEFLDQKLYILILRSAISKSYIKG